MAVPYASGKHSISECDRCGFRYKLKDLRKLTIKTKLVSIKVCPSCFELDQPQLSLGLYPVQDFQSVREPRPDTSYYQSGLNGLQIFNGSNPNPNYTGDPQGGSRVIQWGWNPVGGARDDGLTPNNLAANGQIGTVTVSIS